MVHFGQITCFFLPAHRFFCLLSRQPHRKILLQKPGLFGCGLRELLRNALSIGQQRVDISLFRRNLQPITHRRPLRRLFQRRIAGKGFPVGSQPRIRLQTCDDLRLGLIQIRLGQHAHVQRPTQQLRQLLHGKAIFIRHIHA